MPSSDGPVFCIHIGLPKTGTTTIQSFFAMHRDALLRRGVLYPQSIANSQGQHRSLVVAVDPTSLPSHRHPREHMATGNVFASLAEEIAQAKARIVVLSAESLSFIRHPETLREALAPHPARIVIYLRRQDSYLASLYNQLVKSRLFTATFDEFLRQHPENAIDYDRLLKLWASAFGRENILAGVFEDYALPTGILNDIAAKAGIDITGLQPPTADTNPALLHSIVALKRRVNALLSSEDERVCCERLFTANNISAEKAPTDEDISNNVARRRSMLAGYQEGNARVAKEYFAGRPKLFEDPGERDSLLPDYGETDWQEARHQAAVRMIAGLVAELARKEDVQ